MGRGGGVKSVGVKGQKNRETVTASLCLVFKGCGTLLQNQFSAVTKLSQMNVEHSKKGGKAHNFRCLPSLWCLISVSDFGTKNRCILT